MRSTNLSLLLPVLAAIALASSTQAASFDYAKAKAEDERAICKNPELSKLDEDMAAAYRAVAGPITGFKERIVPFCKNQSDWIKYRIITFVDSDSPRPVVRFYAGPKDADFMLMELRARFVSAKDNQQEGTDAVQVTPQFQPTFRKHEIQCTAVSINFNKDDEAYLTSNEQCPLFKKNDKDAELKLKEARYYYSSSK